MAIDNTPPRLKLIVTIAIITVVTLVSLDFVFRSYYATMTDEAQREKVAPTRDKEEQRKAEALSLSQAAVPVAQAMTQLASGTRPEAITPQPSDDTGALTGWAKSPKALPASPAAQPPPTAGDGGAEPTMGDAGATPNSVDGGSPMKKDAGH